MNLRGRLDRIGLTLERIRPKSNPLERPMIVELTDELSPHAPRDTERGRPARVAMVPDNYQRPPLPEGVQRFDEWLAAGMKD